MINQTHFVQAIALIILLKDVTVNIYVLRLIKNLQIYTADLLK